MQGEIFNEARKIRSGIRTLDFAQAGGNDDVLGAVYEASQLSFRTGASKNIIVIPCSSCEAKTIGYPALRQVRANSRSRSEIFPRSLIDIETEPERMYRRPICDSRLLSEICIVRH